MHDVPDEDETGSNMELIYDALQRSLDTVKSRTKTLFCGSQ